MIFRNRLAQATLVVLILALGIAAWYRSLDEAHQRFVKNLLRNLPHLPGRYAV